MRINRDAPRLLFPEERKESGRFAAQLKKLQPNNRVKSPSSVLNRIVERPKTEEQKKLKQLICKSANIKRANYQAKHESNGSFPKFSKSVFQNKSSLEKKFKVSSESEKSSESSINGSSSDDDAKKLIADHREENERVDRQYFDGRIQKLNPFVKRLIASVVKEPNCSECKDIDVLIVDDDLMNLEVLKSLLDFHFKIDSHFAKNG